MSFLAKIATGAALCVAGLSAASFAEPNEAPAPAAPRAMEAVQLRADPAVAPIETPAPAVEIPTPASPPPAPLASNEIDQELTCLAKIVVHEAGNQSHTGQLAVAQVVMNRVRSGRFANTICGVALQRGQFFNVHAYNPPRDARWRRAVAIAHDARNEISAPVIGNAVFFRAAQASSAFFNSRPRVGQIGNHVFYR